MKKVKSLALFVSVVALFLGHLVFAESGSLSFASALAARQQVSEADAKTLIKNVFSTIRDELKAGRDVSIRGFGRFYVSHMEARKGRNPKTGAEIRIPPRNYPRFRSSDSLKDAMNKKG